MNFDNPNSKFISDWSSEIESGGYLQLPHDFTRNIGKMNLSPIDALVIVDLLGYTKDRPIAVATICEDLGVSEKSVRNTLRKLSKRKLMHRLFGHGTASRYSFPGLKKLLIELANDRQTGVPNLHTGVRKKYRKPRQAVHTNKDVKNKNLKEVHSYAQLMEDRDELIKKRSV